MPERNIWICMNKEELKMLEEYAKRKGMLNFSQAVEELIKNKIID